MADIVDNVFIDHWVMRVQRPEGNGPFPVLLMLHGWTGDENSMWIFAPRLLKNALLIAPRGLYESKATGGFSWHTDRSKPWPWVNDFSSAVENIIGTINSKNFPHCDFSPFPLVGFSQGAALAYTMAIMHPGRFVSLAGLSGFMPDGASPWLESGRLKGLPVFIAHGSEDDLVPVERARMSVDGLEKAGAFVTYWEASAGRNLSAKCLRGLQAFCERVKS